MLNTIGHTQQFWTMNGSYQMEQVKATLRGSRDDVMIYVDDAIWDDKIKQQDVADLQTRLHEQTPQGSVDPGAGILALERKLFEKDRSPVTLLLTDNNAPFEGFFTPMDLLKRKPSSTVGIPTSDPWSILMPGESSKGPRPPSISARSSVTKFSICFTTSTIRTKKRGFANCSLRAP